MIFLFCIVIKNAFEHGTIQDKLQLEIRVVTVKENLFNSLENKYAYVDFAKITIADSGPGFEPRFNEYIFDVLKRLDNSGDRLGFGLAFARELPKIILVV